MAKFIIDKLDHINILENGESIGLIQKEAYNKFNESILGLGDIETILVLQSTSQDFI
jgi:hypothetical protein